MFKENIGLAKYIARNYFIRYEEFLNNQNDAYLDNTDPKRQVIDFIAGMTDEYFLNQVRKYCKEDCKIA